MAYIPGKSIILSRLPAKEWFTLDEVGYHSGWGRSFIRDRIKDGSLQAQEYQRPEDARKGKRPHLTYRVHVDDLALFIIRHGSKMTEERPFRDVAMIVRSWPRWMIKEMQTFIERTLSASAEKSGAPGTSASTDKQAASPGGEAAACPE